MKQRELCDSIIINAKSIIADAEGLILKEEEIRADERTKVIEEVIENIIPTLYEHNVHQVTIDNTKRLLEQLKLAKQ